MSWFLISSLHLTLTMPDTSDPPAFVRLWSCEPIIETVLNILITREPSPVHRPAVPSTSGRDSSPSWTPRALARTCSAAFVQLCCCEPTTETIVDNLITTESSPIHRPTASSTSGRGSTLSWTPWALARTCSAAFNALAPRLYCIRFYSTFRITADSTGEEKAGHVRPGAQQFIK